jgi:hypothetical protein
MRKDARGTHFFFRRIGPTRERVRARMESTTFFAAIPATTEELIARPTERLA